MTSLRITVLLLLAVAGCQTRSAKFCAANPDDPACGGSGDDGSDSNTGGCGECTAPKPLCDMNNQCAQCLTSPDCDPGGTAPVCEQEVCRGCTAHTDCPSSACLPDGSCGTDTNVAYVDPVNGVDAGNKDCDHASPCKTIGAAIASKKTIIKLTGTITEPVATDKALVFLADPGTRLTHPTSNILTVMGGPATDITVYDLAIGGIEGTHSAGQCVAMTSAGKLHLIRTELAFCDAGGLEATAGQVTVAQSSIHQNTAGGINLTMAVAAFDITNTFIFRNGDTSSASVGGASLIASDVASSRFDFNTIVDNNTKLVSTSAGLNCDLAGFHSKNNLIAHNAINSDANATTANKFGICSDDTTAFANATGSFNFKQPNTAPFSYALTANSAAIDQGKTTSDIGFDVNGTTRPKMMDKDQGAFEFDPAHP
jgi:hypothetical protein